MNKNFFTRIDKMMSRIPLLSNAVDALLAKLLPTQTAYGYCWEVWGACSACNSNPGCFWGGQICQWHLCCFAGGDVYCGADEPKFRCC